MITKEIKYDDAVVNGFLALFLNLIVLPLLVVVSFMLFKGSIIVFLAIAFSCISCSDDSGLFFAGTERSPCHGILREI